MCAGSLPTLGVIGVVLWDLGDQRMLCPGRQNYTQLRLTITSQETFNFSTKPYFFKVLNARVEKLGPPGPGEPY